LTQAHGKIAELTAELEQLRGSQGSAAADAASSAALHAEQIAELQRQLEDAEQRAMQAATDAIGAVEHMQELTDMVSKFDDERRSWEQHVDEWHTEKAALTKELEDAKAAAAAAAAAAPRDDEALAQKDAEITTLLSEVTQIHEFVSELEEKLNAEAEKNEQLTVALEQAKSLAAAAAVGSSVGAGGEDTTMLQLSLREKEQEIERLENEVEQWMAASEQLQKLGEDAVADVTTENERLRAEALHWQQVAEKEAQRRRESESELNSSESKLNDLDSMLQRLMGGRK
jgi:chromosome segregation ATPase